MVASYVYRKSDGRFIGGGFYDARPPLVGDPPTPDFVNYGVAEFADADVPGPTDMFDPGTGGKRPMTEEELSLFFPPPVRKLSRFEFMGLLTAPERIALRARAAVDPVMADALGMLELASHVEPTHPMITQMLDYTVSLGGIMTPQRRAAFVEAMNAAAY